MLAGAAEEKSATPPRLFDAVGRISFLIPENWTVNLDYAVKPLFTWSTPEGSKAEIYYEPGPPLEKAHLQTELEMTALRAFAREDVARRHPQARVLASEARTLVGRNAYEITWVEGALQQQSVYVFIDDKFLVISLRADKNVFAWQVPDFQTWLQEVRFLVRRDSGALPTPARGGVWIQTAAGARVTLPNHWLIGVADDRMVGAVFAQDQKYAEVTVTADLTPDKPLEIDAKTKTDARAGLAAQNFKILTETEEPFHGHPAFRVAFEGYRKGRYIKGVDLWVASPKARWLISLEGDGPLFNRLGGDFRKILDEFEFL